MHNESKIKTMTISTKWTLINFILSIIGSAIGFYASDMYTGKKIFSRNPKISFEEVAMTSFLPTFFPAAICLGLLFFSEKLCSSCCKVNLPIVYKTGVDINDFSHIIDLQTGLEYGTIPMRTKKQNQMLINLNPLLLLKSKLATFWKGNKCRLTL